MGDSICLTPALKAVKRSFPKIHTTILLFHRRKYSRNNTSGVNESGNPFIERSNSEGTAEVFKGNPFVDEVLELDRQAMRRLKGFKRLSSEIACIKYLRRQKYDAVICTFPQNRFVLWSFFAGIKIRIGEKGQKFDYLLTDKPAVKRSDAGVLNYFCDLLKPLAVKTSDKETYYNIPDKEIDNVKNILSGLNINASKKLIVIHPGASDKDRQLPPAKMAEVITLLSQKDNAEILVAFSEYDEEYIDELNKLSTDKLNGIKTKSISELAGILSLADIAIVNNSGPRHLAAAVGTKTVGLLEKYDDIMWKIYEDETKHVIVQSEKTCVTCAGGKCLGFIPNGEKYGANCMHDIEPHKVFSLVERIINNP